MQVTAEGSETPEELAAVRASGCSDGQGFLLGQPMADPEFVEALVSQPSARPLRGVRPSERPLFEEATRPPVT